MTPTVLGTTSAAVGIGVARKGLGRSRRVAPCAAHTAAGWTLFLAAYGPLLPLQLRP